jgi:hypothetical protein
MSNQHQRLTLSRDQVALMNEVLASSPPGVLAVAAKIAKGEVVQDEDAHAVVDALAAAMLVSSNFQGDELAARGIEIDGLIGVVQQMSEHFYD